MENFILEMDKGELHVHLNGLVSSELVIKLLNNNIIDIPQGFDLEKDLNIIKPAKSLSSYLKPWDLLRFVPKSRSDLTLIVFDAFENLRKSNVRFVELRNSILYIALLNEVNVDVAMAWLLEDVSRASEFYDIKAGLILTVTRGDYSLEQLRSLLNAYIKLGKPDLIVGLDLAGNEDINVSSALAYEFVRAKTEFGLKITIHAGETGNFENIVIAVNDFKADRIGHGTAAIKSQPTLELLKEKDICVEVCPISNRLTNAVGESESHPVIEFINNEVPFVICSDNPSIHRSSITQDYIEFYRETKSSLHIKKMLEIQKKYSFIKGLSCK
ncbi:amidohydrolase family protein [Pseudoalteromonas fuliginea]|uniref:adenosine deaminase n=1 Tax=Pseudoalteromonas fuliginea TaxID=1872678 RepID=A0ABQ6RKE1_9GAMM|nr:adenosine deaminase [Pseudoalteromonas fuliginea]KAA1160366.1 adenosine deaminase [Pseudoalteromonas fuliginea]KAA1169820.1 adenosine deaminase [Pseudoalteromonas fuliginea]